MSGQPSILLIDVGNTRIKYALVTNAADLTAATSCQQVQDLKPAIQACSQVLIASVGHAEQEKQLAALCQQLGKICRFVKTEAQTLGIQSAYQNFATLGVDRWLAVLAARAITPLPVAVIDLGTANTCDVIVGNQHMGGWIAPGFSLMRDVLQQQTHKVFTDDSLPSALDLGQSTEQCVAQGCLAAQSGFVLQAEQYLHSRFDEYKILITGGGQKTLNLPKDLPLEFHPNLVLLGLFQLI